MFWNRKPEHTQKIEPWLILRWWRSAQEHVHWDVVDDVRLFNDYFDELRSVLIEFDHEWSLVKEKKQLQQVIQVMSKKAQELLDKEYVELAKPSSKLLLKASQFAHKKFSVVPFVQISRPFHISFLPDKEISLPLSMNMMFLNEGDGGKLLEEKKNEWLSQFENNEIDVFVQKLIVPKFKEILKKFEKKEVFTSLRDVLSEIDVVINDGESVSSKYLKTVWKIPQFIFGDNQEQAAFTRLLLQKSYHRQEHELSSTFFHLYETSLLKWQLFHPLTEVELETFNFSVSKDTKPLLEALFIFYKKILDRCGVAVELIELYGPDIFLKRITEVFYHFPTKDSEVTSLSNHNLYTLLLEDSVRFCMRHSREFNLTPDQLLQGIIKLTIQRISEFQTRRKQAKEELEDSDEKKG